MELSRPRLLFKWLRMLTDTLILALSEIITGAFNTWLSRHYHFWQWVCNEGSCGREPYLSCHHPASSPSSQVIRLRGQSGYWDVLGGCCRRSVNEIHQTLFIPQPVTPRSTVEISSDASLIGKLLKTCFEYLTAILGWGPWEQAHIPVIVMAAL